MRGRAMRSFRQLLTGKRTALNPEPVSAVCMSTDTYTTQNVTATVTSQNWLDQRANDVCGEWTVARLAGLSRSEGKAERLQVLAGLTALQELHLEADEEALNAARSVRVLTMSGVTIGFLEPSAAALFSDQNQRDHVVLGYVYESSWLEGMCAHVLIALISWLPFKGR